MLSCERKHSLTIPCQGWRQGEVQILLTPGRLVRKFSNVQQCELSAEPLPSGAPVLSIPIVSGLQRLGASVPSDLHGWPDTSLSRGVWGKGPDWNALPSFLSVSRSMCETHPNRHVYSPPPPPPVPAVTEFHWPLREHLLDRLGEAWFPHFGFAPIMIVMAAHTYMSVNVVLV